MLQGLAKTKALRELKEIIESKASLKGLAKTRALKRQNELRTDLGMGVQPQNTEVKEYVDTLIFNRREQILLVQRHKDDDFMPNKWWIAGGKLEQGETLEQGAKRELLEETGIKLSSLQFVEKAKLKNGGVSHRFVGLVDNDTLIHLQQDELQAYRWVNVDELSKFDLLGDLSDLQDLVELASEIVQDTVQDDEQENFDNARPFDRERYTQFFGVATLNEMYQDIVKYSNSPDKVFWGEPMANYSNFVLLPSNFEFKQETLDRIHENYQMGETIVNQIGVPSLGSQTYTNYQDIKKAVHKLENMLRDFNDVSDISKKIKSLSDEAELSVPEVDVYEIIQADEALKDYIKSNLRRFADKRVVEQDSELARLNGILIEAKEKYDIEKDKRKKEVNRKYHELLGNYEPYLEFKRQLEQDFVDVEKVGQKIYDVVQNLITIDEQQADEWAEQNISNKRLDKAVVQDVKDFYRLTGGRLGLVNVEKTGKRAGSFNSIYSTMSDLTTSGSRTTTWHELGHDLEFDPKARVLAQDFIKRRRESDRLYRMKTLMKGGSYRSDEKGYKGNFITPYIGKYYLDGATEVFSMGMQYLSNPADTAMFFHKDLEMFEMIVGYLASPIPDYFANQIKLDELWRELNGKKK